MKYPFASGRASRAIGLPVFAGLLVAGAFSPSASAALIGTTPIVPGTTVIPGLIPVATSPGTLLATLVSPFSFATTAGTTSGTLSTAVYREPSTTLDFYYQVSNNSNSATSIARETDVNFAGFFNALGFRTDGASLTGGVFVNGTDAPLTADRNLPGSVVGFNFEAPISGEIAPGTSSRVLVISTDAADFTAGNASVIDGGATTVAAFEPTGPATGIGSPEPATLLLLTAGAMGTLIPRRRAK